MQQPRETYYGAIFNRLKTLEGTAFARVSRRLHHWNDIPKEQMPYLGVSQVREQTNYSPGRTEDNHLSIVLYVYVNESDDWTPSRPSSRPTTSTSMHARWMACFTGCGSVRAASRRMREPSGRWL